MTHINIASLEVGQVIGTTEFLLTRDSLVRYAGASGDFNPIHYRDDFAQSVGLDGVLAHGMLTMALVGKYISDFAGGAANVLEFGARFTKPVIIPAGENVDLTVSATVSEIVDGKISLTVSATSAGVKVLGMAKAVVRK